MNDIEKEIEMLEFWASKHERLAFLLESDGDDRLAHSARQTAFKARAEIRQLTTRPKSN